MRELEIAGADSVGALAEPKGEAPSPGAACANCGAALQGPFCHRCGQTHDSHKRSIGRLIAESIESVLHLDGRLARTLPDLFLHPGRLALDYIDGRIARHVPPFRVFLVALLIWVFAAEFAAHQVSLANQRREAAERAALLTPQGRAGLSASERADAIRERDGDLKEAAGDRAADLADPDEQAAKVEARHAAEVGRIQARFAEDMANAERAARGLPPEPHAADDGKSRNGWVRSHIHRATANPEYYLSVMFTWGHRAAFLLLPIVGLTLALVYANTRRFYIHDHLLVAMNFLSFVFLANAPGFLLPGVAAVWWFGAVALWTPVNLYQTLRGAYGSGPIAAGVRTLLVWSLTLFAFFVLILALMAFTLTQI